MSQLPATGSWSIYSMQKTLPELGQVGGVLGAHNYLALVDPNGNIVEEMHGVYSDHFTVGGGDSGNYLNVQMWKPNQYMADQTVTSSNAVMSGTQSSMQAAFDSAFNSTANALNATHDLYDGAELFGNSYNSNSVWCTAMHALGVSNPSAYSGPDATPGDETDLSTAPSNNPYVGTNNDPWVQNPSSNTIYYNQQGVGGNQDGSAEDPDNGFVVSDHDDNNLYAWSSMTAQFNANYGEVSSLIDYDNGTSEGDIFSPSNDISEIAVMYSGENSSGVQEQTTTTSTNGSTNVLITASGDIDNSNNATIDVDPGIQATINGNDNLINGATNASLTLEGAGNTATMAGGSGEMISVTDNGTGDVVSTGVCTNLTINGTNNNDTTAGVSNIWINGNGNTLTATQDGIAVGGTNNTVDLTGASTVWAQGSDNTVNADAGVTGVTAYGWGNYDTLDLGNSTTLTVVASNESDQVGNNSSVT
ncbi:MAG: hypothetical protein P4L99_00635, partial [Chthoniobacter sp.]|nr:hypothetical protein [Chthoniobacter sp.]